MNKMGNRSCTKKHQPNKDVSLRPTKYEACQVNKISLDKYDKVE